MLAEGLNYFRHPFYMLDLTVIAVPERLHARLIPLRPVACTICITRVLVENVQTPFSVFQDVLVRNPLSVLAQVSFGLELAVQMQALKPESVESREGSSGGQGSGRKE